MPKLSFNAIQKLDLPLTEIVGGRIGFIHDVFLAFPYEVRDTLPDGGRDLVVLVGKKHRRPNILELAEYPGRLVLVFAPGDAAMRPAYMPGRRTLPPNVVAAYSTNNEIADRRVTGVPLGVRVNNIRTLQFIRQNHSGERPGLLYGNFSLNDQHYRPDREGVAHARHRVVEQLRDEPWAKLDISSDHRLDRTDLVNYYIQTASHRFVLSPEGNGVDCYRTWEALYLGAIPIVMTSATTSAFSQLPMLFTTDYSELSEDYLEQRWQEMSTRRFEIERMLRSYYLHRFLESVSALDDPRFVCWQVDGSPSEKFVSALRRSSHSASGIVSETPVPPFSPGDLMDVDIWGKPDSLRLDRCEGGMRATIDGDGRPIVELPLQTIDGGPFRLTGRVRAESEGVPGLTVRVAARPGVIATTEVGGTGEIDLALDFVARSERTVLSIEAPRIDSGASWLLSDLMLQANL
jgi:hypothetical protein